MNPITRILSDLHFGHPASYVRTTDQLRPLLEGIPRVVFNGDSLEMRFLEERDRASSDFAALRELCAATKTEATFITGNHDATLSDVHHLDLARGAVLVTHGDILFHGISPWSRQARRLAAAHSHELEALGNPKTLEPRLIAARRALQSVEGLGSKMRHARGCSPRISSFLHEAWPPWRPLRIIDCWFRAPARADALAAECRPQSRFVILGHMHWAGIWRMKERIVINTGSFLPFSHALAVDIDPGQGEIIIRRVVSKGASLQTKGEVARFSLDKACL
jgi:predicted phosphodiesterase